MKKYLMNTATGSIDTEENWVRDWRSMSEEEWGSYEFDPFGLLVEVRKNDNGEWEECDDENN